MNQNFTPLNSDLLNYQETKNNNEINWLLFLATLMALILAILLFFVIKKEIKQTYIDYNQEKKIIFFKI